MGYNQGLAVGLAVGIPCFIVFLGTIYFVRRNRRIQRKEDLDATNLDVEMGENGSFEEFGEELHKQRAGDRVQNSKLLHSPEKARSGSRTVLSHTEEMNAAKLSSSSIGSGSKIESDSSKTQSPGRPKTEFQNPDTSFTGRSYASNGKNNSAYDYYDSVIPIMPAPEAQYRQNSSNAEKAFSQPPAVSGNVVSSRNSTHSSRASLTDSQTKSLETLAKKLQGPHLYDKLPSRANTTFAKHNPRYQTHNSSKSSSILDFSTSFEQNGINQHFVNERNFLQPAEMDDTEEIAKHPYRERLFNHDDYGHGHSQGAVLANGMGLENNFDNNITPDTADSKLASQPDVVFK